MKFSVKKIIAILSAILLVLALIIFFMLKNGNEKKYVDNKIEQDILVAVKMKEGYYYNEAIDYLRNSEFSNDERILQVIKTIENEKKSLVAYEGQVYHIFFHSLIKYTDRAFDGDGRQEGYNYWMTTVDEFKAILEHLYLNDFILIDIRDMVVKNPDGTLTENVLYLPRGKKPVIISQDDVCYYEYMATDGFAKKLVLDENGKVRTLIEDENGTLAITDDGDMVPILDDFVERNPSFSYKGAKGILAVTGYEGALGYRITDANLVPSQIEAEKMELSKVAKVLRDTGWSFANHSYTHNDFFHEKPIDIELLSQDTKWWIETLQNCIGATSIYISPFGVPISPDSPQMKYLNLQGFDIFCPVEASMDTKIFKNVLISKRLNLDGYTLYLHPERAEVFFDERTIVNHILDKSRPPF